MSTPGDIKKGKVWHKMTVSVDRADADAVREAIHSQRCCGIQSEDIRGNRERLEAYFDGETDVSDLKRHMEIVAELVSVAGGGRLKFGLIETVPEEDWAEEWRKSWHPETINWKQSADKILVVGAGPAGLECARALGQRGYEVMLSEAQRELGGPGCIGEPLAGSPPEGSLEERVRVRVGLAESHAEFEAGRADESLRQRRRGHSRTRFDPADG